MDKNPGFNCDMCGECCRHIDYIPQLAPFDDGNGVCIHLKNDLCDIYDNRPDICNVDKMYEKEFYKIFSTKEEYYKANAAMCESLKSTFKKR